MDQCPDIDQYWENYRYVEDDANYATVVMNRKKYLKKSNWLTFLGNIKLVKVIGYMRKVLSLQSFWGFTDKSI